jgi:hypothetical protein
MVGFGNKFVPFRTNCLILRRRRVGLDGFTVGALVVNWGVPQGPNLGPLLFRHLQLDGQKLYNFLLTCVCQNLSQKTICITRFLLYKTTGDVILDNFFPKLILIHLLVYLNNLNNENCSR